MPIPARPAHWPAPNQFFWDVSTAEASGIVAELGGLGDLSHSQHDIAPFTDLTDLDVKQAGLAKAADMLRDKVDQLTATVGLLDAEN